MPLVEVEELRKTFRVRKRPRGRLSALRSLVAPRIELVHALAGVSFALEEGECVGYLGPNGAGKSTTVKILTGILFPTSGSVRIGGLVPWRDRRSNARQIGVVFGQRTQLYWDLPLVETLELLRDVYEVPRDAYRARLARLRALFDLDELLDVPVRQLSLGQRMRGDLAATLLHGPRILYLDEPTIGLDVVARHAILEIVRELRRTEGVTVLLTTHNLADVEALCARILLLDQGRLLYDGELEGFKRTHAPYRRLVLHLARPATLPALPGVEVTRRDGCTVELRFPRKIGPRPVLDALACGWEIDDLSLEEPSLEDVVHDLYAARREGARAG